MKDYLLEIFREHGTREILTQLLSVKSDLIWADL